MKWDELITHPYITNEPLRDGDELRLSYSVESGHYVLNEEELLRSQSQLTEKNAILLNCRDPRQYEKVYEHAIQKHFSAEELKQQPVLV